MPHPAIGPSDPAVWKACALQDLAAAEALEADGYRVHRTNGDEVASLAPHHYLVRTEVCPGVLVSTVQLDFDQQMSVGPRQLFETMVLVDLDAPVMVFRREATRSSTEERYLSATESQAVTVHDRLVQDLILECDDDAAGGGC